MLIAANYFGFFLAIQTKQKRGSGNRKLWKRAWQKD